jgi:hypothetical protein
MLISTGMLSEIVLAERRLEETPTRQERRRIARLAAEVARCCRDGFVGRLLAALDRPRIALTAGLQ